MGELAGPSEPPATFISPLRQNAWAHAPALQRPHLGPLLRSPHSRHIRPAGLLGVNPNHRSAPEGPLPRDLAPHAGDWGLPNPSARPTLLHCHLPVALVCHRSFRAGEQAGPSEPPATFEGPPRQNDWAHDHARQRPHLGPPLCSPHSWRIGPARLLGANPKPRLVPEYSFRRSLAPQRRGMETPESQHRSHPAAPLPPGPLGLPPVIHGGRPGRALQAPSDLRRPPMPKRLGPCSRSPAPSPRPTCPLTAQLADRAYRPPGG